MIRNCSTGNNIRDGMDKLQMFLVVVLVGQCGSCGTAGWIGRYMWQKRRRMMMTGRPRNGTINTLIQRLYDRGRDNFIWMIGSGCGCMVEWW